jgi:hypothetical protein
MHAEDSKCDVGEDAEMNTWDDLPIINKKLFSMYCRMDVVPYVLHCLKNLMHTTCSPGIKAA